MRKLSVLVGLVGLGCLSFAMASTLDMNSQSTQPQPMDNRISQLETQMSYVSSWSNTIKKQQDTIAQLNSKIADLTQQVNQNTKSNQLMSARIASLEASVKLYGTSAPGIKFPRAAQTKSSAKQATKGKVSYQEAVNYLNLNEFNKALQAFSTYIKDNPKGKDVYSAYYWLGMLYLAQNDQSDLASQQFRKVLDGDPKNPNAPDALFTLGKIYLTKGDYAHAKQSFQQVIKQYPGTSEAYMAKEKLKSLDN